MRTRKGYLDRQGRQGTARTAITAPTALMLLVTFAVMSTFIACAAPEGPVRPADRSELPGVTITAPPSGTTETVGAVPVVPVPGPRSTVPSGECPDDNERRGWYYMPASTSGGTPAIPSEVADMIDGYGGVWRVDTSDRVVYLTFDEGYEAGYTGRILDALTREKVPAAFFVTRSYIERNPDLVRRMTAEGHVVANHSDTHPSMPALADDPGAFETEFVRTSDAYHALTGEQMARFFRPPMGDYSERTLCMTERLGYTSVMWSFAHRDWLADDQPSVGTTVERVVNGSHPGAVLLLHAVSESNTEALPEIIRRLRADGYRFGSLAETIR